MSGTTYSLRLVITHDYTAGAAAGLHDLRVLPARVTGRQEVLWSRVETEPAPAEFSRRSDFFGNTVVRVAHPGSHAGMTVRMEARVRVDPPPPALDIAPPLSRLGEEIAEILDLGSGSPLHVTGPSARVPSDGAIADYAQGCLAGDPSARQAVVAIGAALHRDMIFDAEATQVDTPARVAFAARRGVCQDFSHVMISALRAIGVPAAYVSGFLRTEPPSGQPRLEGADAMHAWVRAWCGREVGWLDFDPTNGVPAGRDHVVVAVGRDYDDVAPVRGILRAAGGQSSSQAVDMVPEAR